MTPVINTANVFIPPPTIAAAVVPGNDTVRLNADNVTPTLNNIAINNENKNNNSASFSQAQAPATSTSTSSGFSLSPFIYTTPTSISAGARTNFFAQLLSQDSSPQAQGVLEGYEQLVSYSQVKYMPSNATLPEPEPASVFARVLQQERQAAKVVQQQITVQQPVTASSISSQVTLAPAPKETGAQARTESTDRPVTRSLSQSRNTPAVAINAYRAVVARNEASSKKSDQPVEEI